MNTNDRDEIEAGYSLEKHVEGESRRLAAPLHVIDLEKEAGELRNGESARTLGHTAKTLIKLPNLKVVLISLTAGGRLARHVSDGEITIHTISGRTRVQVAGQLVDIPAGRVLSLERSIPHDLEATEDSTVLLTIARNPTSA
jgi:quercetin dioxygenase-like cupin family protein